MLKSCIAGLTLYEEAAEGAWRVGKVGKGWRVHWAHTQRDTNTLRKHFNSSGLEWHHSGLLRWKMWVRATLGILPVSSSLSDSQAVSFSVSPFLLFSDTTLLLHHSSIFLLHHLNVSLPVNPYFIFLIIIPIIQKPQRSKFLNSVFLSIYCVIY